MKRTAPMEASAAAALKAGWPWPDMRPNMCVNFPIERADEVRAALKVWKVGRSAQFWTAKVEYEDEGDDIRAEFRVCRLR